MVEVKCLKIVITGIVQGVGFRPFIYNNAKSLSLNGWVNNTSDGVIIEVEGSPADIVRLLDVIRHDAPPLSRVKSVITEECALVGYKDFEIRQSLRTEENQIYISPDVSICDDCKRELFNPADRRYLYPFINCTNCGPRFTIVKSVPYDRINTTMDKFPMCEKCKSEYSDPMDRRYHAQPVSCYDCGPRLKLVDSRLDVVEQTNLVGYTIKLISEGKIVAVKGLGGYHLACNASNEEAVRKLRKRKIRDDKPFAVMVRDSESAMRYCHIDENERKLLESPQKPIVLLKKKENTGLPDEIAPGNPHLGIMLPYTPVHMLLFGNPELTIDQMLNTSTFNSQLSALVMTSGNRSSEPIYYRDEDAFENLRDIADYFLVNDRDIHIRTDDSVTRVFNGKEFIIRRSRGYAPTPVTCEVFKDADLHIIPSVLACGGELKNTFCMNKGNEFYLSHHIGDLENFETLTSFEEGISHFSKMFNINYKVLAYDLHPEYLSTKYADRAITEKKVAVQHHHAHIASCMAENLLYGDVIGVAFDGTGYGEDGNIWGGEFFTGSYTGFERAGHLDYVRMPGGEVAIKEPWRMAVAYLHKYSGSCLNATHSGINVEGLNVLEAVEESKISIVLQMLEKGLNSPLTSSMGRLFDAVSALIGVRNKINYEGQAAIELEQTSRMRNSEVYDFAIKRGNTDKAPFIVSVGGIFKGIVNDLKSDVSKEDIAGKFHETVADIVIKCCERIREDTGIDRVVLSGGVFQNMTLLENCARRLEVSGFKPYFHSRVPTNDAGIALGQAVIAAYKHISGV